MGPVLPCLGPAGRGACLTDGGMGLGLWNQHGQPLSASYKGGLPEVWEGLLFGHSVVSDSYDPMHCSPRGYSVHEVSQARTLEWAAISFSRDRTCVSCVDRWILYHWTTKEAPEKDGWEQIPQRLCNSRYAKGDFDLGKIKAMSFPRHLRVNRVHPQGLGPIQKGLNSMRKISRKNIRGNKPLKAANSCLCAGQ